MPADASLPPPPAVVDRAADPAELPGAGRDHEFKRALTLSSVRPLPSSISSSSPSFVAVITVAAVPASTAPSRNATHVRIVKLRA